jgi:hypothetical protein
MEGGEQTVEAGEGMDEEEALDAPLVFQCGRCRAIVGDSFSFVCADQTLRLVCVSGTSFRPLKLSFSAHQ